MGLSILFSVLQLISICQVPPVFHGLRDGAKNQWNLKLEERTFLWNKTGDYLLSFEICSCQAFARLVFVLNTLLLFFFGLLFCNADWFRLDEWSGVGFSRRVWMASRPENRLLITWEPVLSICIHCLQFVLSGKVYLMISESLSDFFTLIQAFLFLLCFQCHLIGVLSSEPYV